MPTARGWRAWQAKNGSILTASICLVFKGQARILAPLLIMSVNNLLPWRTNLSTEGNMISIMCCCAVVDFDTFEFKVFKSTLLTKFV